MLKRVLIANRGEIACRIMRTLKALGIASVAVYHHEDRAAPHVQLADEAVRLKSDVPTAAYLDQAQIVECARRTGAGCVHPGYGFLSENAAFAERVSAGGSHLHRAGGADDSPHGRQDPRARLRRAARRAGGPERDRAPTLARFAACAAADRFSAADQGRRRRWRQGHAHRAHGGRACREPAGRGRRGAALLRRRPHLRRALHRAAASHRGADPRRRPRQCRAPVRARVLGAAPLPEDHRGVSGARICRRTAAHGHLCCGGATGARGALPQCRHGRIHPGAGRGVLLPGDEYAPAGRAPGHRVHSRAGSGRRAAAHRRRAPVCRSTQESGASRPATPSSAASAPRNPSTTSGLRPVGSACCRCRRVRTCASTAACASARRSPRPSTRCWPSWWCTAQPAPRPRIPWRGRWMRSSLLGVPTNIDYLRACCGIRSSWPGSCTPGFWPSMPRELTRAGQARRARSRGAGRAA